MHNKRPAGESGAFALLPSGLVGLGVLSQSRYHEPQGPVLVELAVDASRIPPTVVHGGLDQGQQLTCLQVVRS